MTRFTGTVTVRASPRQAWDRLTDWPAHERWVPLTSVRLLTEPAHGVGARFVARTGLGPLAVDDVLAVTRWQPPAGQEPGRCELAHVGRVVLGTAVLQVRPLPSGGLTEVSWSEDVEVTPVRLTRPVAPLFGPAGRAGLRWVLRRMRAELERA